MRGAPRTTPPAQSDQYLHLFFLLAPLAVVLLAATMDIHEQVQVRLPFLTTSLPELCHFRRNLGLDCPGCGLTRSFIALAHGQWALAWQYNPAGVLLFPFVAFQIPYHAAQLLRLWVGLRPWNLGAVTFGVLTGAFLLMFVQWVVKVLSLW